jgi:hypothetical protein
MADFTQVEYVCIKIQESDVVEVVPCPPGFTLTKEEKQIGHVINVLAKDGWRLLSGQGTITPGNLGFHHACFVIIVREKGV